MVSIDNVEGFRKWLIKKLQPICDADPEALAKYVLALVKKDKNENDLKVLCLEQLEVFLKNNTENFVEDLFESLKLKSYMMELNEPSELGQDKDFRKDKNVKMRSRSRSPIRREIRHRSPNDIKRRIGDDHRSRRRSPDNRRYYSRRRSISPRNRRVRSSTSPPYRRKYRNGSPNRRSRSRSPHNRKRSKSRDDRRDSPNKRSTEVKKMGRCFDYDEKGYCIEGESCPYDHGTDAIAVEEETLAEAATNITNDHHHRDEHKSPGGGGGGKNERSKQTISIHPVLNIPPPMLPGHPPLPHLGLPPPQMIRFPPPSFNIPPPRLIPPPLPPPYNPELPSLGKEEHNSPMLPTVTVATMGNIRKRIVNDAMPHFGNRMGGAPPPKRPFSNNYNRRVLLITKIPLSLNNITKLNEHFAPFGAINNIQVKFDSRADQAIVEFAHHNSAKAALTDPGAVLNNRFIRLCWFDPDKSATAYKPNNPDSKPSVKDRLGTIPKKQDFRYTAPGLEKKNEELSSELTRTIDNSTGKSNADAEGAATAAAKTSEEKEKERQQLEAQRKLRAQMLVKAKAETQLKEREMQLKRVELNKQYQLLLHKNLDQQKLLMKKLESNDLSAADKKDIRKTITTLHNNVIKLRESCKSFSLQAATPFSLNKEPDDKQLKHNKTGAGGVVAPSSGGYHNPHHHHHHQRGGGFHHHHNRRGGGAVGRGGGRSYLYSSEVSLDRRPNQLVITGFLAEEKDDLQAHFEEFGAFDSIIFDENITKCTLKYKSRNVAQQAAVAGRTFKQKKLNIIFDTLQPKATSAANNAGDATSKKINSSSNGQNATATSTNNNTTSSAPAVVTKQKTVELEDFKLATLAVIDEAINKKDGEDEDEESDDEDDVQVELNVDTINAQQQQLFDDEYREFDLLGDDENLLDEDELLQGNEE